MKFGVIPDAERAPDSPDTALHIAPRVGAQTRTKGDLYLLVTSRVAGPRAREATRMVADAIRSEYYYDESAGIRVCLVKAIQVANKRLGHAREKSALGTGPGPIGVGLAVVRDNELYVCTVGPAEAYLNRGARLSTLPDPHRDVGLPSSEVEPDVWRGEINVGDQLTLVSPAMVGALGADALKDALVTLHPQSAVESLTARFRAGGGTGSDGALIIEAAEVAVSRSGFAPVPVRPAEPLAGKIGRASCRERV
jgi:Serine/threonine protein phosphatase